MSGQAQAATMLGAAMSPLAVGARVLTGQDSPAGDDGMGGFAAILSGLAEQATPGGAIGLAALTGIGALGVQMLSGADAERSQAPEAQAPSPKADEPQVAPPQAPAEGAPKTQASAKPKAETPAPTADAPPTDAPPTDTISAQAPAPTDQPSPDQAQQDQTQQDLAQQNPDQAPADEPSADVAVLVAAVSAPTPTPAPSTAAASVAPKAKAPNEAPLEAPAIDSPDAAGKQAAPLEKPDAPEGKPQQTATPSAGDKLAAPVQIAADPAPSAPAHPTHAGDFQRALADAQHAEKPAAHIPTPPATLQVAQQIVRRFDGKSTSFDLRMDPPELGRVDVRLEVSNDQRVTALVSADNQQTLNDLMRNARELERALADAGLDLSENGLSFDLAERHHDADDAETAEAGALRGLADDNEDAAPSLPARPLGLERWGGGRVDVWA